MNMKRLPILQKSCEDKMEKPKQIDCTNPECYEGTIEIKNGAETSLALCPICGGTGYIPNAVECDYEGCINGKIMHNIGGESKPNNCPKCNGKGWYIPQKPTDIDQEISLSICMIVGKEEANLQRCLDSILPITFQSWCELIIICTQKGDRTEEIARQYTDRVEFQEWENDFSKHRNYGIALAKGKRIFIIDADEELQQASLYLIQDMVRNPEYSEYGTMFIKVNNILSKDRKAISTVEQPRIFLNPNGEPIYTGTAHNKAKATEPYFIANNVCINHYGYDFETNPELKKQKFDRTMPLLLKQYGEDKNNLQALTHIIKTYHTEGMHKEVMQYSKHWIKLMQKAKKNGDYNDGWAAYHEVFNILVASCIVKGDIRKAKKFKKISEEFTDRLSMIYFHIGYYYGMKKNDDEAVKYLEKGVQIANKSGGVMEGLTASHEDMFIDEIFVWLAVYYLKIGDRDKAGKYINAGVTCSKNPQRIRWDIWNQEEIKKRYIFK